VCVVGFENMRKT